MKYTCPKTPSMFRKCDNIFLLCNVTHLRLGLGKLFMLGIHETWTFLTPNQKELKTKIEPAFFLILNLCSFLFLIWYDGRKMDQLFEKKLIWEVLSFIWGIDIVGTTYQQGCGSVWHNFPTYIAEAEKPQFWNGATGCPKKSSTHTWT